jgi:hypothetical protein
MKLPWRTTGRVVIVMIGAILLTTFSIDATDTFRGSQTALSRLSGTIVSDTTCAPGMVMVTAGPEEFCIDAYENSIGPKCSLREVTSVLESKSLVDDRSCVSVSESNQSPMTYVSYHQAQTMCAKRGLRLPTSAEWYAAALGTPDDAAVCNMNSPSVRTTGTNPDCMSLYETYDMLGNAWEWVSGEVVDGNIDDRALPPEGFIVAVDTNGFPTETGSSPAPQFNEDYLWTGSKGVYAMMRGGFYGSGSDGGLYALYARVEPSFGSIATGYRCVKSL